MIMKRIGIQRRRQQHPLKLLHAQQSLLYKHPRHSQLVQQQLKLIISTTRITILSKNSVKLQHAPLTPGTKNPRNVRHLAQNSHFIKPRQSVRMIGSITRQKLHLVGVSISGKIFLKAPELPMPISNHRHTNQYLTCILIKLRRTRRKIIFS